MEVLLLARRRGLTLSLPPRLAVRRNPAAASRGLMISKTWMRSGVNVLPDWRLCWCPRCLRFLYVQNPPSVVTSDHPFFDHGTSTIGLSSGVTVEIAVMREAVNKSATRPV